MITGSFRVFGCRRYIHIPEEKRNKLDERINKGIFVGYSTQLERHRIYNLIIIIITITSVINYNNNYNL